MDGDGRDELFGSTYCLQTGRHTVGTRLMATLHYLKYGSNFSDEDVVEGWVENPYWQFFGGMKFFEDETPIDPSSMARWRIGT